MGALTHLRLPTPLPPPTPPPSHLPTPIDSIRYITGVEKNHQKTSHIQVACRNSYEMIATV